jgi:hypothetical protein
MFSLFNGTACLHLRSGKCCTSDRFPLECERFGRSDWPSQPKQIALLLFLFVNDALHFLPLDFSSRNPGGLGNLEVVNLGGVVCDP